MTAFQDLSAEFQPASVIQIQHVNGRAAGFCEAGNAHSFEREVFGPAIPPRMK